MLSISNRPLSPLNHHQHFQSSSDGRGRPPETAGVLPPGERACPLLSAERHCKLEGDGSSGLAQRRVRLQTLGLTLVPATAHLDIVGQELEER